MAANLFYAQIVKEDEDDFILRCISTDKDTWYVLPEETNNLETHPILLKRKIVKNSMTAINKVNGYRTISIKMEEDIQKEYFDETGNVCFQELPLEEGFPISISRSTEHLPRDQEDRIRYLEQQLKLYTMHEETKLQNIENKFILEKFAKGRHDPTEWIKKFENECNRFQMNSDTLKIQALRFFITGPVKDWYEINMKKIGLKNTWEIWKTSFFNVFINKGWVIVRKAFKYKYLDGSLIDYALTKEKLCLEMEPNGTELTLINHVVFGLPNEVQEKIDREEITTLDKLYSELRKLEGTFVKKTMAEISSNPKINEIKQKQLAEWRLKKSETEKIKSSNNTQRNPCPICKAIGFPNRYHPPAICRNKNLKLETNITKYATDSNDMEIMKIDIDEEEDLN